MVGVLLEVLRYGILLVNKSPCKASVLSDHGQQRPRYLLVGHMPSDTAYFSWLRSEEEVVYCACPENVNKSAAVGRWQDLLLSSCLY